MSFPSDFTRSSVSDLFTQTPKQNKSNKNKNKKNRNKNRREEKDDVTPTPKKRRSTYTAGYAGIYSLPPIDISTMDFEIWEDKRCAVCDGDLEVKDDHHLIQTNDKDTPELCKPCTQQVAQLKLEQEIEKRERDKRQMEELERELMEQLKAAELRRELISRNERVRRELEEIERESLEIERRNAELRARNAELERDARDARERLG